MIILDLDDIIYNMYADRLHAAIMSAPHITLGDQVPSIDNAGNRIPGFWEDPGIKAMTDYDPVLLNPGYVVPVNAVAVPQDRFGELYDAYCDHLYRQTGIWPRHVAESRKGTIAHEERHGAMFGALGARAVFGAMRFAHTENKDGQPILMMTPYTVAPDVRTFKLGAAAVVLAPPDPSAGDFAASRGFGYTPGELRAKIQAHNDQSRSPHIPQISYTGL